MYRAHAEGRAASDPSRTWYEGELGFFDHYIIPLAEKLRECEVFGVSSDEFLIYATNNRSEWQAKGRGIVAGYVAKYGPKPSKDAGEEGGNGKGGFPSERMFL
jgi:hypothetical protein